MPRSKKVAKDPILQPADAQPGTLLPAKLREGISQRDQRIMCLRACGYDYAAICSIIEPEFGEVRPETARKAVSLHADSMAQINLHVMTEVLAKGIVAILYGAQERIRETISQLPAPNWRETGNLAQALCMLYDRLEQLKGSTLAPDKSSSGSPTARDITDAIAAI